MENITKQIHSKETFLYATSRILERASYYGLRSLIVLYMVIGNLKMENTEAYSIYGWFTASFVFSNIFGAILGDLLIGNRKAIIIGGIIQSLGAFSFCFPSIAGLYAGLFLVVLGGGLYTPNIISNFGKLYLNKIKLIDAGFTIFYLAINLGAFIGVIAIGYIGEKYGWNFGFVIAGILMLLSIIPILFSKDKDIERIDKNRESINQRIKSASIVIIIVGVFWAIYELGNIRIYDLQIQLSEISTVGIPESIWSSISSMFFVPISLLAIIIWTYFYSTQFFKLMVGFMFGAFSFIILFLIPEIPNEQHLLLYLLSLLLLGLCEIYLGPIVHSILTQYSNPRYLAIIISLAFIPTRLFSYILSSFNEGLVEKPTLALSIAMIAMSILSIALFIYYQINKKLPTTTNKINS